MDIYPPLFRETYTHPNDSIVNNNARRATTECLGRLKTEKKKSERDELAF